MAAHVTNNIEQFLNQLNTKLDVPALNRAQLGYRRVEGKLGGERLRYSGISH